MKTAKEWAEYLPLDIKLWFIEECERQKYNAEKKFKSLEDAINSSIYWNKTKLGDEFWEFVWNIALDYDGREAEILKDLEWIDDKPYTKAEVEAMILEFADPNDATCRVMLSNIENGLIKKTLNYKDSEHKPTTLEVVEQQVEPLKKSSIYGKVIKGLKIENEALTQSNLKLIEELNSVHKENDEFKKRHKSLLQANQESMERRVELGEANMKLLSENTELKARCEALEIRNEVLSIEKLTLLEEFTALQVKTMEYQDMVISSLNKDLEARKEELTYWQQLKQLFGCN